MDIFTAYIKHAYLIALIHGGLSLICLVCIVRQRFQLKKERRAYAKLKPDFLIEVEGSELSRVAQLTHTMTRQGEVPNLDAIRVRLLRHLASLDIIIRFCLNAFIVSGLLGTLFNLWNMESFWPKILAGGPIDRQESIGTAFSASVFGLGLALVFSLVDSVIVRFAREVSVQKMSADLFDAAAKWIPPTERAVIGEALEKFFNGSEGLLVRHETLSRQFIAQIQTSSNKLDERMTAISARWGELVQNAATTTAEFGTKISVAANDLTSATTKAGTTLTAAAGLLKQTQDLNNTLVQIRNESAKLQAQMTKWTADFSDQWRTDLSKATESHTEKIETVYKTGLDRFNKSADHWQEKNAESIKTISNSLEQSFEKWREERQSLPELIDGFTESLQNKLGQAATRVNSGMVDIRTEVGKLESAVASLAITQSAAANDLRGSLAELKKFSQEIANETLLGSAITNLQTAISDLHVRLSPNGMDGHSTVSVSFPASESIESILRELKALSAKISTQNTQPAAPSPPTYVPPPYSPLPAPNPVRPPVVLEPRESYTPPKSSLWSKFRNFVLGNK